MRQLTFEVAASALLLSLLAFPAARMPFVDAATYEQAFLKREKRPPARLDLKPATAAGVQENLRQLEAWFTDRHGFRMELIALKTRLYLLAGQSPREDLVILGKDGWLFYDGAYRAIEKTSGRRLFSQAELEASAAQLEERRRWLAARGAQFLVVIAPEKQTIYQEKLPGWARNRSGRTMTRQLAERLRGGEVPFLDLAETLRLAKRNTPRPLYYVTDSHWNAVGAFAAYRAIMNVVGRRFPEARTLREPPFLETTGTGGDLSRMLVMQSEPDVVYTPVFGANFGALSLGGDCSRWAGGEKTSQKWLTVEPNGCEPGQAAVVTGSGLPFAPRVLVLGDSFAAALSPYLNQSFETVVYTHFSNARRFRQLRQYVERYKPDLVVLEMTERALTPAEPRRKDRRRSGPRPPLQSQPPVASAAPSAPASPR